jgi:hypothetical protein
MINKNFYVYGLYAPGSDLPRYFGKGSGNRIVETLRPGKANNYKNNWLRANPQAYAEVIADQLSEAQAFALEKKLICEARAKGLNLVNATDGGEGVSGAVGLGPWAIRTPEQHAELCHPEGSPRRAQAVILYRFETQEFWEFSSGRKAAEYVVNLLGKNTRAVTGALNKTKNKEKSSIYGFSCFLPSDFTPEEIARRTKDWSEPSVPKPVKMLDKTTGKVLQEFPSAMEASRQTNTNPSSISKCCKGKLKTTGGYTWKFKTSTLST